MFFVQTCEGVTLGSLHFWENRVKFYIYCNILKKSFANFHNFLAAGGISPRTPYLADRLKCPPPPNRNPCGAAVNVVKLSATIYLSIKNKLYHFYWVESWYYPELLRFILQILIDVVSKMRNTFHWRRLTGRWNIGKVPLEMKDIVVEKLC